MQPKNGNQPKITIRALDEKNFTGLNQCDDAFIVDSKLCLSVASDKITYTLVPVPRYEKRYSVEKVDYSAYIRDPDKAAFLAYVNEQIAGQIILRKSWNGFAYIENLAVDSQFRKLGVGRKVIAQAVEWAKAKNLSGLMLETQNNNVGACRFYERCGFRLGGFDNFLYRDTNRETDEVALFWYLLF